MPALLHPVYPTQSRMLSARAGPAATASAPARASRHARTRRTRRRRGTRGILGTIEPDVARIGEKSRRHADESAKLRRVRCTSGAQVAPKCAPTPWCHGPEQSGHGSPDRGGVMSTVPTGSERASRPGTRTGRRLVLAMGVLLLTDLVGGLLAVAAGVNSWTEAWGGKALLAAPVPMVVAQLLLTWLSVRTSSRWSALPAGLLAAACLVSVVSGFFDGGIGNDRLSPALAVF